MTRLEQHCVIPVGGLEFVVRRATEEDLPRAVEILRESWRIHYSLAQGGRSPEDYIATWASEWTRSVRDQSRGDDSPRLSVLEVHDDVIGYLEWSLAPDWVLATNAGVNPQSRFGTRSAGALYNYLLQLAGAYGKSRIRLYTNARMRLNIRLYESAGFMRIGQETLEDGTERLLMERTVPSP